MAIPSVIPKTLLLRNGVPLIRILSCRSLADKSGNKDDCKNESKEDSKDKKGLCGGDSGACGKDGKEGGAAAKEGGGGAAGSDGKSGKDAPPKVGINGFDKLGHMMVKMFLEKNVEIAAINEPKIKPEMMASQFKNNTNIEATATEDCLTIKGKKIPLMKESNPEKIQWKKGGAEYIVDTTMKIKSKDEAAALMKCGGKKVIVTGNVEGVPMVVHGLNMECYKTDQKVISAGTPTLYSIGPITRFLDDCFKICELGITSTGKYIESPAGRGEFRLAKNDGPYLTAMETKVGEFLGQIYPPINGKLKTHGVQVPVYNSVIMNELTIKFAKDVAIKDIKCKVYKAAEGPYKGVIGYVDDDVVSNDFVKNTHSITLDASASQAISKNSVKLIAWSDNVSAFANAVVEMLNAAAKKDKEDDSNKC